MKHADQTSDVHMIDIPQPQKISYKIKIKIRMAKKIKETSHANENIQKKRNVG